MFILRSTPLNICIEKKYFLFICSLYTLVLYCALFKNNHKLQTFLKCAQKDIFMEE
jgi:hypothetical protein